MLFKYVAFDQAGKENQGSVDAVSMDVAIASLQRRGLVVSSVSPAEANKSIFDLKIKLWSSVKNKDIVVFSRQIATLFAAQVSALRAFKLMATESTNSELRSILSEVGDDLQAGSPMSKAMEKHPDAFSTFYVSMVRAGEESGKLEEAFNFLADYLERNYELTGKAKNALIYPAFVTGTFLIVMLLMMTLVVPRVGSILEEAGQELPIYTKIVLAISNFLLDYWIFLILIVGAGVYFLYRFTRTEAGKLSVADFEISVPYVGSLYRKFYLARIADNLSTMVGASIPIVRSIEVTADIVGNAVYAQAFRQVAEEVRAGSPLSEAMEKHKIIPGIMITMVRVGEETGNIGNILRTLARFYNREVSGAVDTLVNLIEPVLIVALALGVAVLLASVLIPIYNISSAI